MLGLACDNASPNDVMVDILGDHLEGFEGSLGRVRCFAHVLNLVVKTLLRQFDVPKAKSRAESVDNEEEELLQLTGEDKDETDTDEDGALDDGDFMLPSGVDAQAEPEGWVDEMEAMSEEERAEFARKVRPVQMVLIKVSEPFLWLSSQSQSPDVPF